MENLFFEKPILNSPYKYPARHWELDAQGQPTQQIIEKRRRAEYITPIPKPKKRKTTAAQQNIIFDEGKGLSSEKQQYDPTPVINNLRYHVDKWRSIPNPSDWRVTPETARLLQHWRHHQFSAYRPFFCQVEAVETVIWLTEVAPNEKAGKDFLEHLENANNYANPNLMRLALKLATGAGKTTVMAMLIAWQTINAVRHPNSKKFTRGFLVVTPGIGKALAECFAREGSNLFLGSHPREEDQLGHWADYLEHQYHIKTRKFPVDLSLSSGPELLHKQVVQSGEGIDILVNNAGVMLYGCFAELPLDGQIEMISVNVIAYAKLMRLFLPDLMKSKSGRILNVVSASAFQPTPHHAVYGASKAFVQSLSEAVGEEIKASGIKICTFNPSYTDTPLLRGKGFPKKLWWFSISGLSSPEDIARKGVNAFKKGKRIYIPGIQNWFAASVLTRIFPRRIASYIPSLVLREKGNRKRQK